MRFAIGCLLLLSLWLNIALPAGAGPLADRLAQFPHWTGLPPTQPAVGDLVYPDWFSGTWQATTTLIALEAPLAPTLVTPGFDSNRDSLNQSIQFTVRFIKRPPPRSAQPASFGPRLPAKPQLVSDRAFNGLNIARAYLGSTVTTVRVDPDQPNQQTTILKGDRQLLSLINARASETPSPSEFITTEVFQQIFRGTSQPYLNRVETTTDYRHEPDGSIHANQITAIYLSPQDPNYFQAGDRPVALYQYDLTLQR